MPSGRIRPVSSRDRKEIGGRQDAFARTLPPHQRFIAAQAAGGEVELRLVEDDKFVPLQRQLEIPLQRGASLHPPLHLGVEEGKRVAALALCLGKGGVRRAEEEVGAVRVHRIERGADARAQTDGASHHLERRGKGILHAAGELPHGKGGVAFDDQSEFIPGNSRDRRPIRGKCIQPFGDEPQDLVPHRMSPDVVHRPEPLDIDHDEADLLVCLTGLLDRMFERLPEAAPGAQFRQRVARQRIRIEGLSLAGEAAPAGHDKGNGHDGEHGEPDGHHADDAERPRERLERQLLVDLDQERPKQPVSGDDGYHHGAHGRLRQAEQARQHGRMGHRGPALDGGFPQGRDLFRAKARARARRVAERAGLHDPAARVEIGVADDRGERPGRLHRRAARQPPGKLLRRGDGIGGEDGADEEAGGRENGKPEREADEENDDGCAKLRKGHGSAWADFRQLNPVPVKIPLIGRGFPPVSP